MEDCRAGAPPACIGNRSGRAQHVWLRVCQRPL